MEIRKNIFKQKILKFEKGDSIPTFSADYSSMTDEYYKRYIIYFLIMKFLDLNSAYQI